MMADAAMTADAAMVADAPWLAAPIAQLQRARTAGRFPTAVLIHERGGAGGEGLGRFAAQLALGRGQAAPYGQCRDCRRLAAGRQQCGH